ncbi:two-component sensor histidine kinase [Scytonema sp. HK-05]|nr:hypothetical protein NIES2130_31760 [Scytonema sp. HK-05]BAY47330.1 two-component sensor histidine kinase [Scytonema sp. HK-05]
MGLILILCGFTVYRLIVHIRWLNLEREIGITSSEQTRIFHRFYRVQQDRCRHSGGSGLGLAIANAIAQAHHGDLLLESELGKGSIFTVRLPLERAL